MRTWLPLLLALLFFTAPLSAAPVREDKIFIYFVYDQGNPGQRKFIDVLYDRFKVLGFRDFLKKEGIAWVEGNYSTLTGVLNYLNITHDDLIYFAVVTADKNDRLIREIVRTRIPVPPGLNDRQMKALADKYSSQLYYDTQNTHDLFVHNWKRQTALLNPEGEGLEPVTISLNGTDVKLPSPAYQRSTIETVMVPYTPAFFKQLGIDASTGPGRSGSVVHLKRGPVRLDLASGDVQDRKIFEAANGGAAFVRPIDPAFAYPEVRNGLIYVPLHLVLTRLSVPVQYAENGSKVVLTEEMTEAIISLSQQGAVGLLTIRHPASKVNPYDFDFMRDLASCIDTVRRDDAIKVAVLTGTGNFFSAGADIGKLSGMDPQTKAMFCLHCQETINLLEQTPKIILAALNGHTVGGGLEVALACDFRFMAQAETGFAPRIGTPEVKLGVLPGTGGTQRLPRLIGRQKALQMMVEGQTVTPDEALALGLVDKVFPRAEFMARTMAYAEGLAGGATRAMGLIKIAVQQGLELPLSGGLALERELQNRLFMTEDAREGLQAYVEKRQPHFTGR